MTNQGRRILRACALVCVIGLSLGLLTRAANTQPPLPRELAPFFKADRYVVPDRYIVVFNVGRSPRFGREAGAALAVAQRQSLAAQDLVRRLGGTIGFQYNSALVGFSATLPPAALDTVRALPGVAHVETVREVFADIKQDLINWQKGLDRIDQRLLKSPDPLDKIYYWNPNETGLGVNVYVIDSGIRTTHVDFQDTLNAAAPTTVRAFSMQNFAPNANGLINATDTTDCNGHGTTVAGIIGGYKLGVAKRVELFAVRVLGCNGGGTTEGVLAGINHVRQHAVLPAVVNMSIGAYALQPLQADQNNIDAQESAIINSMTAGLTYVVSAGNDPTASNAVPDPTRFGEDACLKSPAHLSVPAAGITQRTITVGAIDPMNDTRWQWSNWGSCVTIFAPGYDILSTDFSGDAKLRADDGTSFAAPHVAGAAARYLEGHTGATPLQVRDAILHAANVKGVSGVSDTTNWPGITDLRGSPNIMLHWGSLNDGYTDGEPHIKTVDGIRYDFQSVGEFVALRDDAGFEIQTRQTAVATATPLTDPYTGLANCVAVNTAVAMRMGKHRITFQPDPHGEPRRSGLQLRVNGRLTTIGPDGLYLGSGRIAGTPGGGLNVAFPDGAELLVTPGFWNNVWYLNLNVLRTSALEGIMGASPEGSWLPALPNGGSLGPMPASLEQRHVDLNRTFADAWRISDASSLFDYAAGTSTATFTDRNWPPKDGRCDVRGAPPQRPIEGIVAQRLCGRVVDTDRRENCVRDVMATGEATFAKTYALTERVLNSTTRVTLSRDKDWSRIGEPVTFTAVVESRTPNASRYSMGSVRFVVDGRPASEPIALDRSGRASWRIARLRPGVNKVIARFTPSGRSPLLASSSLEVTHTVRRE